MIFSSGTITNIFNKTGEVLFVGWGSGFIVSNLPTNAYVLRLGAWYVEGVGDARGIPSRELKLCSWLYKFGETPRRAHDPLMGMWLAPYKVAIFNPTKNSVTALLDRWGTNLRLKKCLWEVSFKRDRGKGLHPGRGGNKDKNPWM